MSLLINSNKTGFEQLLSDRAKLAKRLQTLENEAEELKSIITEFDDMIKQMRTLYYPSSRIIVDPDNPNKFVCLFSIRFPKTKKYKLEIGEVYNYKDHRDPELIKKAHELRKKFLMNEFPEYFL